MNAGFALSAKLMLGAGLFVVLIATDLSNGSFRVVPTAEARIGRPLTPVSYAGVARRTTYRAAAVATTRPVVVVPPPVVVQPVCVDTVDAYGVVTRVCR